MIHPSAVVDRRAEIDSSAEIGAGAVIGANVSIGPGTIVGPYAVIQGQTTIGARNRIFQFASIGADPQDLKYRGEPSRLEIGDDNRIREFTTIHRGTEGGGMVTRIGNRVLLMNYVHVAHDCVIGDDSIIANSTEIAGHCVLEEWVVTAGMCGIHQFSRIGAHAIVAAGSKVAQDVPPYSMVAGGDRARLVGVNTIGLERRGFKPETIAALKAAFRKLFYSKLLRDEAIREIIAQHGEFSEIRRLVDFISNSPRGVVGRDRD
ncbi:MAG TPA: acyl-ACP--UDP-N-acetylglucosamine O-acyltransferase [Candidatus Binataceae bacterium]|nr:acyl-ACP--UDP-N-acetylglucosamine O-acyltransferase [Candidatus Binataceae bacterium]